MKIERAWNLTRFASHQHKIEHGEATNIASEESWGLSNKLQY
jgi:hypothetical protein